MTLLSRNKKETPPKTAQAEGLSPVVLELLASRICHDLISPVGAIHNGIEFLQEMGADSADDAIALLDHSAKTAAARLQAFRLVYGLGGRDPHIEPKDVYKTFGDLLATDEKVTQDWDPRCETLFSEHARPDGLCKMLMGALMLAQECLPKGGTVTVTPGNPHQWIVTAHSESPLLRPQVGDALARTIPPDDLDPRLVHPYAIAMLAAFYNFNIAIAAEGEQSVTVTLTALPKADA